MKSCAATSQNQAAMGQETNRVLGDPFYGVAYGIEEYAEGLSEVVWKILICPLNHNHEKSPNAWSRLFGKQNWAN